MLLMELLQSLKVPSLEHIKLFVRFNVISVTQSSDVGGNQTGLGPWLGPIAALAGRPKSSCASRGSAGMETCEMQGFTKQHSQMRKQTGFGFFSPQVENQRGHCVMLNRPSSGWNSLLAEVEDGMLNPPQWWPHTSPPAFTPPWCQAGPEHDASFLELPRLCGLSQTHTHTHTPLPNPCLASRIL